MLELRAILPLTELVEGLLLLQRVRCKFVLLLHLFELRVLEISHVHLDLIDQVDDIGASLPSLIIGDFEGIDIDLIRRFSLFLQ